MKFIGLFSFLLLAAFIGQTFAEEGSEPAVGNRYQRHRRPHRRPYKKPCGSNGLGDYRGGCDESVPVLVMPKGRPIMERVLDWFNCENCNPSEPETPITTVVTSEGTIPTATGTITTSPTAPLATVVATSTGTGGSVWYPYQTPSDNDF